MQPTLAPTAPRGARRRAFTLIELLVVIAIIAILAAILFPVFARARENARRISCLSNLKQIGLGFLQYTQDYDESYPLTTMSGMAMTPQASWTTSTQPYLKSVQIFRCPSDAAERWNTAVVPPAAPPYTTSYILNAWFSAGKADGYSNLAKVGEPIARHRAERAHRCHQCSGRCRSFSSVLLGQSVRRIVDDDERVGLGQRQKHHQRTGSATPSGQFQLALCRWPRQSRTLRAALQFRGHNRSRTSGRISPTLKGNPHAKFHSRNTRPVRAFGRGATRSQAPRKLPRRSTWRLWFTTTWKRSICPARLTFGSRPNGRCRIPTTSTPVGVDANAIHSEGSALNIQPRYSIANCPPARYSRHSRRADAGISGAQRQRCVYQMASKSVRPRAAGDVGLHGRVCAGPRWFAGRTPGDDALVHAR